MTPRVACFLWQRVTHFLATAPPALAGLGTEALTAVIDSINVTDMPPDVQPGQMLATPQDVVRTAQPPSRLTAARTPLHTVPALRPCCAVTLSATAVACRAPADPPVASCRFLTG